MTFTKTCSTLTALVLLSTTPCSFAQTTSSTNKGTSLLEQTSQAFTQIAKKAMPATVFIKAQAQPQGYGDQDLQGFLDPHDEFFRRFFGFPFDQSQRQQQPQQQQISGGSGFFVSPDGFIVTNNHVVKDAGQITVVLNDGREFPATISGTDPRTDLAVLKINETNLPYLSFGDSDELNIGEWVIAIGTPFALESSLTVGVVSAKGRQDLGITPLEDFIQTDAAINPGNSGGPLLNLEGDVIGVNTAIFSRSGGYMGIGFSIPSRMAQHVIDQIIHQGTVKRAYLGVMLQAIDKELADALGLEKQEGVLISDIMKGSPAEQAGLLQGDVVLQYNNKPVKNVSKFRNDIALMEPGKELKLNILRNNSPLQLCVALGTQTEGEIASTELIQKIGLEVENLTPETSSKMNLASNQEGVVISKIKQGSPAQQSGLRPGYLIVGVAGSWNEPKTVKNINEFAAALKELGNRKHIILIVRHQNYQRYYTIKLG
jgi:serine protease Do